MRFAEGPGSESSAFARLRTIGAMMPPPRAVSDGTTGASTRSEIATE